MHLIVQQQESTGISMALATCTSCNTSAAQAVLHSVRTPQRDACRTRRDCSQSIVCSTSKVNSVERMKRRRNANHTVASLAASRLPCQQLLSNDCSCGAFRLAQGRRLCVASAKVATTLRATIGSTARPGRLCFRQLAGMARAWRKLLVPTRSVDRKFDIAQRRGAAHGFAGVPAYYGEQRYNSAKTAGSAR